LSSGKSKKKAIFFKKNRFLGKYGAFSMVFRVVKRRVRDAAHPVVPNGVSLNLRLRPDSKCDGPLFRLSI
jgi:hypothetical protein